MLNLFKRYWLILLIASLTACNGGGGSSNSSNPITPNNPPLTITLDPDNGGISAGESNVSVMPLIQLNFNQAMNPATINSQTITLTTTSTLISGNMQDIKIPLGTFTASHGNELFSVSPLTHLAANTYYVVTVTTGIAGSNGGQLGQNISFGFTTGSIATPTVILLSPQNNESDVSLQPLLQLQFSESVTEIDAQHVILQDDSESAESINFAEVTLTDNNIYTFSLNAPLQQLHHYRLILESGISSVYGANLAPLDFSFTTGKFNHPTAALLTPVNGANNVMVNPIIQLQFSESVVNVDNSTVELHNLSNNSIIPITNPVKLSNNVYQFSPKNTLPLANSYSITASSQISDDYGNSLIPESLGFATVAAYWQTVGNFPATTSNSSFSMAVNPYNQQLYLAYSDNNHLIHVTTFDGLNLHELSNDGITQFLVNQNPDSLKLALDPQTGRPEIAFIDNVSSQIHVFNFSGSGWSYVGESSAISSLRALNLSNLIIANDGRQYIGFVDIGIAHASATVMNYSNGNWNMVGQRGFTDGLIYGTPKLMFNSSSQQLVLAYAGLNNTEPGPVCEVWNFIGNTWKFFSIISSGSLNCSITRDSITQNLVLASDQEFGNIVVNDYTDNQWNYFGEQLTGIDSIYDYTLSSFVENQQNHNLSIAYNTDAGLKWDNFNGTTWSTINGPAAPYLVQANAPNLAINSTNNTPYLAYFAPNDTLTVYQYLSAATIRKVSK